MLQFSGSKDPDLVKCTPNLLPCRIHHDGPVEASPRYWNPELSEDGKPEAHFRGRRLKGLEVRVPEGYKGVIVEKSGEKQQQVVKKHAEDEETEADENQVEMISAIGSFDEMMLWGHDTRVPEDDSFVRGIREWISFAETERFLRDVERKGPGSVGLHLEMNGRIAAVVDSRPARKICSKRDSQAFGANTGSKEGLQGKARRLGKLGVA